MKSFLSAISLLLLTACVIVPPKPEGFIAKEIRTSNNLSISVWEKENILLDQTLRLYIEGDGDPNPSHLVALDFAERDTNPNVIYIARPCQWSNEPLCKQKPNIYGQDRFHTEIMSEMTELITYLMKKYHATDVELIGYDGGAVVALNVATKVPTKRVITIAGIVGLSSYNAYHNLPDTEDAEDPEKNHFELAKIPQIHYVGARDEITPRQLAEYFVKKLDQPKSAVVKVVPDVNHVNWQGVRLDY